MQSAHMQNVNVEPNLQKLYFVGFTLMIYWNDISARDELSFTRYGNREGRAKNLGPAKTENATTSVHVLLVVPCTLVV